MLGRHGVASVATGMRMQEKGGIKRVRHIASLLCIAHAGCNVFTVSVGTVAQARAEIHRHQNLVSREFSREEHA